MMNQNLPNGVPPQFSTMNHVPSQDKSVNPYNGLGSIHSSRDSSPVTRFQQIPSSQLPPLKTGIPPTQLPPTRGHNANFNHLTQNYGPRSISSASANETTPFSSPKVQTFNTSTPTDLGILQDKLKPSVSNFNPSVLSPICTSAELENKQSTTLSQSFTHSATSQFTNVVRNIPENKSDDRNSTKISESTVIRNTPVAMSSEMVDVCLDESKSEETPPDVQFSALAIDSAKLNKSENLQKPFDINVFTNKTNLQQNLIGQAPKPVMSSQNSPSTQPESSQQQTHKPTTSLQNIPHGNPPGSYQEHKPPNTSQLFTNLKNQQINQPPPINQYPTTGPITTGIFTNNMPVNIPVSSKPQENISYSNMNIQTRTQIQNTSNTGQQLHHNPQFRQNSPQMTNGPKPPNIIPFTQASTVPAGQAKQNLLPPSTQRPLNATNQVSTFNPSNRPKFQTALSQPRLNSYHIASNNYPQSVQQTPNNPSNQYLQTSQSLGSMPNLMLKQMPPKSDNLGVPQNTPETYAPPNIATSTNIHNPPTNVTQTAASPHSQNQMRPHMHSNRYPMQQPAVNYANIQQQSYQGAPTYPTPQQPLYQTKPESQSFSPNVYQNQVPQNQPPQIQQVPQNQYQNYNKSLNVTQSGFNKLWGTENYDLLQSPNILPSTKVEAPNISLGQDFLDAVNCNPDIFRCTMTKIPETSSLLQKSRLPLGVLIHPFRDLNHLPVIQCNTIVRCRACRTYINPFVFFVDAKRWKCNLCYRINELPEEFQYDPVSKTYGDPSRRPEVKASTIEYIAPAEYMLRPPQPAVYLYLFDVSRLAVESGYLHTVCNVLSSELENLPGDARTHVGFLAYDSALHFYSISEGQNQPHEMTIIDVDDVFLPCPDNLLVNLQDRKELVSDLLSQLPTRYNSNYDTGSALGAALQIAYKMMAGTGGRVTVFQAVLPNFGPGSLSAREDPSQRAAAEISHLNPANDFYKRLALECSGQQIAVDLFILNSQYVDLATISGISRFSGGCMHHFPLFKASRTLQNDSLERCFRRYVTRKIGFEAVMRIRCTRGLSIHTFHGNFFVRSTDLLSLPNINPDAGFGMQVSIEENLSDVQTVCFQAALLYTSSKGERRIRVHTICLPVASSLTDIINSADQQCIVGLLSKMAVDRSMQSSLSDAREAFLNVAIDILTSYKISLNMASGQSGLMAPQCLKLLPLYISALLKSLAFRIGTSTRLDDRVKAMCDMKTRPLPYLIQQIYPDLYPVHNLEEQTIVLNDEEEQVHIPPHMQLTARNIDSNGAYLLDMGEHMVLFVCSAISLTFLDQVLGVASFSTINDEMYEIPTLDNPRNQMLQMFIGYLNDEKPFPATIQVIRENSPNRGLFLERLIEDRMENSLSYHEFLQHVKTQVK